MWFLNGVSNILKLLEVKFKCVNVLADQSIREGIKVYMSGLLYLNYMLKMNL